MQIEKLNFKQIKEILESELFAENGESPDRFMCEYYYPNANDIEDGGEFKETYKLLGDIKMVEHYGGEGMGDDYYSIYHFVDHDIYIQFQGWYASHYGTEYSEMYEVKPKQVLVTKYETVN